MMALLDIFLGLILIYLIFAIVVTGVQEWWSQYFGHRGKFLREGLARLIGDESVFVRVLQHPLVGGLYRDRAARGKPPSYIDPANFALAFANVVIRRANPAATQSSSALDDPVASTATATQALSYAALRDAIANLSAQRSPVANAVLPIIDQARGNLDTALKGIEAWFSCGMDRVTGWYKAYAQKRLFVIGFVVAALGNVDTIAIYQTLSRSSDLRGQLAQLATTVGQNQRIGEVDLSKVAEKPLTAEQSKAVLKAALAGPAGSLPIGYSCLKADALFPPSNAAEAGTTAMSELTSTWQKCRSDLEANWASLTISDLLLRLLGWVLTALAGVLGAPYWFAALSKVINIRGSGPKPKSASASA